MQQINEILDAKLVERHKSQEKRNYLGASAIGDECLRKVQLQYMGKEPEVSAQQLRTFDIGHCLEDLVIQWLRIAGFYVITRNENGEQFGFSTADGKLQGHVDGIIQGFPKKFVDGAGTSPTAPWLLEIKTMNNKSWNDTKKHEVLVSKPIYYAQVQLYMAYMAGAMERCLFVALNKDTSELYFEVIAFDSEAAQKYSDRAVQVLKATKNNELLPCVSGDPSFYLCKMCAFRNVCREQGCEQSHE